MKKRIFVVFLCVAILMAMLPTAALAAEDISSTGLDLYASTPTEKTTYTAGSGTVTWDPTVSPATLTFDGATIEVSLPPANPNPAFAVTLPDRNDGVNVVFKGTNSITAKSNGFATPIQCYGETTITLLPDSDTTLNAGDRNSTGPRGIYCNFVNFSDTLTITGRGKLTVDAESNNPSFSAYAIDARERSTVSVALNGGTLNFAGCVIGKVTLGGVTIPSGNNLYLHDAASVTKGTAGAVINGELHLKDGTTLENINDLDLTGSGVITVDGIHYIHASDKWVRDGEDFPTAGLDLARSTPKENTVYKAGAGTVLLEPTIDSNTGDLTGGKLTLNGAQISLGASASPAFLLPGVPMEIELVGKSTITSPSSGFDAFFSSADVTMTGSGTIEADTDGDLIYAYGQTVTLNGGTRKGRINASSAMLNNITIPERYTLDLEAVSGNVSATDTVNNGTLVLKRKADTNADIAAIKVLNLTGSGYVKAVDGTTNYYDNNGVVLSAIGGTMDFSLSPEIGSWSDKATVEDNGYEFSGDSTNGYTLKLGNVIMESSATGAGITLPGDGSVQVTLVNGTTTHIFNYGGGTAISVLKTGDAAHPCTITGNGKLLLTNYGIEACLKTSQPLTVAGGDISINNYVNTGIFADNTDLTISGGRLKIAAQNSAVNANSLTLKGMAITGPAGAAFDPANKRISDADGKAATNVTIEAIIVNSVTVDPAAVSILKGGTQQFTASVAGINNPPQTVTWSVDGGSTGTSIDGNGKLTVAATESATTLTVKATSTVDTTKSGSATVTVTAPPSDPIPKEYDIIKGQNGQRIKGSSSSLSFTADADYNKFAGISMDGVDVPSDDYTSESGSTIITLKASYLKTLSVGRHTLRINFEDGYAETSFTILAASDNPVTGDDSMLWLWLCIAAVAAAGLAIILVRRQRQNG